MVATLFVVCKVEKEKSHHFLPKEVEKGICSFTFSNCPDLSSFFT
jgi:hypothetical protein